MAREMQLCCRGYSGCCQTADRLGCYLQVTSGAAQPEGHDHPVLRRQALPEDRCSLSQKRWNPNHPLKKKQGRNVNSCHPYVISTSSILSKSTARVFSHSITWKTFPIPFHMRSIFYVFKTWETVQSAGLVTRGLWKASRPICSYVDVQETKIREKIML